MFFIEDIPDKAWKLVPEFTGVEEISVMTHRTGVRVTIQPPGTVPPDSDADYPGTQVAKNTAQDFRKDPTHLVYLRSYYGIAKCSGWV